MTVFGRPRVGTIFSGGSRRHNPGDNLMQIKKAVSISLLLAILVGVVALIPPWHLPGPEVRKLWARREPHRERDEFHFVVKAAEWDLHATKVCIFFWHRLPYGTSEHGRMLGQGRCEP